jgi:fatty-acid peroxygenase
MDATLQHATQIPRESAFDSTIALLREGYLFMPARFRKHGSDIFEARLMLRRAFCVMGEDASRMFFHPGRFTRKGAIPPNTLLLLQDRGSVQTLDGGEHQARKRMFMALAEPGAVEALVGELLGAWDRRMAAWRRASRIVLHTEMEELLCEAACRWTGVPLAEADLPQRAREFAAMIDGAGAAGPRNWRGLALRARTERWARECVRDARTARLRPGARTALHLITHYRDPGGRPLEDEVAAVELLNAIRPVVAIARYITFAALALHEHPAMRVPLADGDADFARRFVLEVRRRTPFFTAIGGRALHSFEWRGQHFPRDAWVLFDVHGTLMDPRIWTAPERFDPDRFLARAPGVTDFAPQGAGDYLLGHRCPGEPATIAVIDAAARRLATMRYEVPQQDLSVDLARMPAIPASRFVIAGLRA